MADQAHLIASASAIVIQCKTCPPEECERPTAIDWIGACNSAMNHIRGNPGHVVVVLGQQSAVYADQGELLT